MPEMRDIEIVVSEGKTFKIVDNDGVMTVEEMNDTECAEGRSNKALFLSENAVIRLSVASVAGTLTVSFSLDTIHSSNSDLNLFKKHVRICSDSRETAYPEVERRIVENGLEQPVIQMQQEAITGQVTIIRRNIFQKFGFK